MSKGKPEKVHELLDMIKSLSRAKGIEEEWVFQAMESALAKVTRRRHENQFDVRIEVNRETGYFTTYQQRMVVDTISYNPTLSASLISLDDARAINPDFNEGDTVENEIESIEFGRIDAHSAKQTIIKEVRDAERHHLVSKFKDKVNTLVAGTVKKVTRDYIILDLGDSVEGQLLRSDTIPNESFRANDRVRAFLFDAHYSPHGPQLFLSRTCPEMLIELFRIEVPEIGEQVIQVKSAARDPGSRAKIAVKTNDGRIDPIGACVGMRGSRVQAVSNELHGERIDIILWDDNPAQLVINAMSPAEVESIIVDEDSHTIDIAVAEEQLSQAIGRNGQNVRLASELTGWALNIMSSEEAQNKTKSETEHLRRLFVQGLDVDEDIAMILIEEGFTSIEEIAYVPLQEMLEIEDFSEDLVNELRGRAKDHLLNAALADEDDLLDPEPSDDLLNIEGMQREWAFMLAKQGIKTMEDLAELAVDDLLEITDMDEAVAAQLIMKAREPWFREEA